MAEVYENISLKPYNTFGIDAHANYFTQCTSVEDFYKIINDPEYRNTKKLILGGGSNILFTKDFEGLIIQNSITGVEVVEENEKTVTIRAGAGEDWDSFVEYTVNNDWCGLENLSYIPGNVGASPIQNIGAYGEEAKNSIKEVETIDLENCEKVIYQNKECRFGYRNSIFKEERKGKSIITHVVFTLQKKYVFNLDFGILKKTVNQRGEITLQNIRDSVIEIRSHKLPDPKELGSAGSFFKNPVISEEKLRTVQQKFPNIPYYEIEKDTIKIPAAWLIDKLGWKGYRKGDAGVHKNQALVLVNYGKADGEQIYLLSQQIIESVEEKYGIHLEYEVNIL
ncbi:MAG: UDP-N-acetylmuramate dehydrogenase [Bacteroidales bacterium]